MFIMEFYIGLKEELQKEGKDLHVDKKVLNIMPEDIVKLNKQIDLMADEDGMMIKSSPIKASRFVCKNES